MASSCGVHDVAVQGYNDTKAADLYAAARPGYSEEAVTRVLRETNTLHRDGWGLRTNTTVLDLGAGTGKMTLSLVGRALFQKDEYGDIVLRKETPSGIQIIAVEPVEGMRKKCKEQLLTCGHGVTVKEEYQRDCDHEANGLQPVFNLNGSGSQIPLPTASVDLVVIAQAFHWFASRESMEEIARVLKRGTGQLALIWNTRDKSVEWVNQLEEVWPIKYRWHIFQRILTICHHPKVQCLSRLPWLLHVPASGASDYVDGIYLCCAIPLVI
eukprot:m.1171228 g.1171228  ORF g.1171228 m.1171228 type:complete len:269 (-) comp24514_c0_seq1:4014-4820(-)